MNRDQFKAAAALTAYRAALCDAAGDKKRAHEWRVMSDYYARRSRQ